MEATIASNDDHLVSTRQCLSIDRILYVYVIYLYIHIYIAVGHMHLCGTATSNGACAFVVVRLLLYPLDIQACLTLYIYIYIYERWIDDSGRIYIIRESFGPSRDNPALRWWVSRSCCVTWFLCPIQNTSPK
jgi:hypothetical protein